MNYTLFLLEVYLYIPHEYQRSNRPKVASLPNSCFVDQHDGRNAKVNFHGPNENLDVLFDGQRSMRVHCTQALNMPMGTKSPRENATKREG